MLKINVIGNLTSDFELRTKPNEELPYAIMRIASDRRYRDKDGNKLTDFVSIKVRGQLAERCVASLGKGARIAAMGDFETISTPDENGVLRQTGFLIKANDVEFLSPKKSQEDADFKAFLSSLDEDAGESEAAPAAPDAPAENGSAE